jgi:hypothetical protein
VSGNLNDLDQQDVSHNPVDDSRLQPEPGGAIAFPLAGQGLIVKTLDRTQPCRAGQPGNVFPVFLPLQDFLRHRAGKLPVDPTVFLDAPHRLLCLCHK